mmetsp:Transcript_14965/g.46565  ORF Transcript_14965/g.46565 Transcript_14965/m.46565 type:complete len:360 (+) Transcript_14965:196-1275(+)
MCDTMARSWYLPTPSGRTRSRCPLPPTVPPPAPVSSVTAPEKSASAARSRSLPHCRSAALAMSASKPIALSISTDSAGGSAAPPPPLPPGAAAAIWIGASMSGSSMCSSSQFMAGSEPAFCVASAAFWQRSSGKPIDASCATTAASACGAAASAAAGAASAEPSSGSSSSPGRRPPSPGACRPSASKSSSSGTSSSTSSLLGTQLSPTTNFLTCTTSVSGYDSMRMDVYATPRCPVAVLRKPSTWPSSVAARRHASRGTFGRTTLEGSTFWPAASTALRCSSNAATSARLTAASSGTLTPIALSSRETYRTLSEAPQRVRSSTLKVHAAEGSCAAPSPSEAVPEARACSPRSTSWRSHW